MELMTYLTRRQAWLSPTQISGEFRHNGAAVTVRTIHRWFSFLRNKGYLVYYPYPRANLMDLQEVLVWMRGLRSPDLLGMLPFGSCFSVEVGMGDAHPFITQGYWIPGDAMKGFHELWRAAEDLELVEDVEVFQTKNSYFFFSPFEQVVREDGVAEIQEPVNNRYFEDLARRNLQHPYRVELGEPLRSSPLLIPLVFEHVWTHSSSRQVWRAIRGKGADHIKSYAQGNHARALSKEGSALRLLQQQWGRLLRDFDHVFLQPRVAWYWHSLDRHMLASLILDAGSMDRTLKAARRASEVSIWAALRPGLPPDTRCYISCFLPASQLLGLVKVVGDFHRGSRPPTIAIQDEKVMWNLFQTPFCKVDWTMFDPSERRWRFPIGAYMDQVQGLRPVSQENEIYAA